MRPATLKDIYLSLLLAFIAYLLPWSGYGLTLRPDFVLVVLLFWLVRAPQLCNVGTAWLMGLAVDLASGSMLGQSALAYALSAFGAVQYQRRLVLFTDLQQSVYVLLLLLLSQLVLLLLKLFAGSPLPDWSYFMASLSGLILWQILAISNLFGMMARNED